MSWVDAVPAALVTVAWLLLPGLPSMYALGLRGLAAWGMAPVAGVALLGLTAIVAGKLGIAWSVGLAIGVSALAAVIVGGLAFLLRRKVSVVTERDPLRLTSVAGASLVPAVVLGAITIVRGFGRPDNLSQTYDALFHYNAIALIVDTGNGSSLTLSSFGATDTASSFYPAAWHDLAALVVSAAGTPIPVAANLVSAVGAVLLWPLGMLLLARQIFGRSYAALAITGVISVGFAAGPWGLLGFGVLWPNALGLAMIPAGLAVLLSIAGLAKDDALGRGHALILLPVVVAGATLAHPGALFSLIALGVFPLGHGLLRRTLRLRREGRIWRGVGEAGASLMILGAAWYWTATTPNPAFRTVREIHWPAFDTPTRAAREVLLNGTNGNDALLVLSVVVLVGVIGVALVASQRWLIPAHLMTGFLYVVAAAYNLPETRKFTGYWYNDSYRLAAVLPVTAVPLAVAGIPLLAKLITARVPAGESAWRRVAGSSAVIAVALAAVLVVGTRGMNNPDRTARLASHYLTPAPGDLLADADQRAFLGRIKQRIPEGSVVANNPWDGSGMLWALADRRTLFPHFTAPAGTDQLYLAYHLSDAASDPRVCGIAHRLRVDYLLIGDAQFWPWDDRRNDYPGFRDPGSKPGFQLLDSDGARKLYRLTACSSSEPSN
jgi:uncharacterized membrane protein SirB2